jgi:transcriptional regulator GlxA family with amidase domain
MDGRVFHLREQLLKKLQHHWTIAEMAESVELSLPHFQRLFKFHTGLSPITYLREVRLEKARELLETTFWRVQQVGVEVGMPNDSHFTRDFKKRYGSSPTEYRKLYWEKIQSKSASGKK